MSCKAFKCILTVILISFVECYYQNRRNAMRRQRQQVFQNPGQTFQASYTLPPVVPQFPLAYPVNIAPGMPVGSPPFMTAVLPPKVPHLSSGNQLSQNKSITVPLGSNFIPQQPLSINPPPPQPLSINPPPPQPPPVQSTEQPSVFQPENTVIPSFPVTMTSFEIKSNSTNDTTSVSNAFFTNPETIAPYQPSQNMNDTKSSSRRKRKNAPHAHNKLKGFPVKEKKLLAMPTLKHYDYLKNVNRFMGDISEHSNTTVIPIKKGIQIKSDAKYKDHKVHAVANITSNTQRTALFDNNTEIENVVEMQMEKKIENDKGDSKGSEVVRIIESEYVKPIRNKMKKIQTKHENMRKQYSKRFITHHRSKRNSRYSEEIPVSKVVYDKMAHRFLDVVRRKERVVHPTTEYSKQTFPNPAASNNRDKIEEMDNYIMHKKELVERPTTEYEVEQNLLNSADSNNRDIEEMDQYLMHKKELVDFMKLLKLLTKQMQKIKQTVGSKKNFTKPFKSSCTGRRCSSSEILKIEKALDSMNVVMNLNITWNSKSKELVDKLSRKFEKNDSSVLDSEITTIFPNELNTQKKMATLLYENEKQDSRFLTVVLLFSAVTFLLTMFILIIPKLYHILRLSRIHSAQKTYKICDENKNGEIIKDPESMYLLPREYLRLEWQSEDGDWLSEKE